MWGVTTRLANMWTENNNTWQRPTLPQNSAVPSAQEGLTAVFGMGTGVSPPLSSPGNLITFLIRNDTGVVPYNNSKLFQNCTGIISKIFVLFKVKTSVY